MGIKELKMGTTVPDFIQDRIEDINNALEDCLPFQPIEHDDNAWLMEVAEREAQKIVDFVPAIRKIHNNEKARAAVDDAEAEAIKPKKMLDPETMVEKLTADIRVVGEQMKKTQSKLTKTKLRGREESLHRILVFIQQELEG